MPATRSPVSRRRRPPVPELSASPRGTEIGLPGSNERVAVAARPDGVHAERILHTLDRVLWQRLEVGDGTASGVVAGTRRHRPVQLRVGGGAALGLVERGVPTVVCRTGTSS